MTAKVGAFFAVIATILILGSDVCLLVFAGVLLSTFLISLSAWLQSVTHFRYGWCLFLVCVLLLVLLCGGLVMVAPDVANQIDQLTTSIPKAISKIQTQVERHSWTQPLMKGAGPEKFIGGSRDVLERATGVVSNLLGWTANAVIIIFVGLYGAVEPGVYKRGFLRLIPKPRRPRIHHVMEEISHTLKWWLIGKFISMTIVGSLTWGGLWLLDVPLALILAIIAALLTFIPNIGPILSAAPAVLLGFVDGPQQALSIVGLYVGIQVVESYLLTPLVQRKTIHLPPALTLVAQVLLGLISGGLGVALATPLTAAALVATKRLYVEDTLGDSLDDDVHEP